MLRFRLNSSIFQLILGACLLAPSMDLNAQEATPPKEDARVDRNMQFINFGSSDLGEGPWEFDTGDYHIKVTKVVGNLDLPWAFAFLPNGDILVTERAGQMRVVRRGVLDPTPLSGVPKVLFRSTDGLSDVKLHPNFQKNHYVYFTYAKASPEGDGTCALARGRFDGGTELKDVEVLFTALPYTPRNQQQSATAVITWGRDAKIYMTCASPNQDRSKAQDPNSHRGKILRLNDDGTAPTDNPFVGAYLYGITYYPEIFTVGMRVPLGITVNPLTGDMWEVENGPQGGDEMNLIQAGKNYGWPIISMGREYAGPAFPHEHEGMVTPPIFWVPDVAPSSVIFYNGDKFPKWKGNALVSTLKGAHIERIVFNAKAEEIMGGSFAGGNSREHILYELHQRIRQVQEGPDGNLYVLTDYTKNGAILKIEPTGPAQKHMQNEIRY